MALETTDLFVIQRPSVTGSPLLKATATQLNTYVSKTLNDVTLQGNNSNQDITLGTDNITLDASDGSIRAAGGIRSLGDAYAGISEGVLLNGGPDRNFPGSIDVCRDGATNLIWKGWQKGIGTPTSQITAGGSITAAGRVTADGGHITDGTSFSSPVVIGKLNGTTTSTLRGNGDLLLGGNIAGGSPNITLSQAGNITATGNLSVTGTTSLNNFVYGNTINSRLFIADTISLSSNKEIEFNDVNVKIARESTSVTQLNFDILRTTQASVRNGRVVIGDEKISLTTGGAITTAGTITAGGMIAANGGLEAYIPTNNLLSYSQRWFDDKYTTRGLVGAMGIGGSFWVKQALTVGLDQNDAQVTLSSDGSITAAGSATFAGALEAESIDGGTY